MRKLDTALKREIETELAAALPQACNDIGVAVRDGIVTLGGHIETYVQKLRVAGAVDRVAGVRAIALEIDVRQSPDHLRSDTDIARAAEKALAHRDAGLLDALRLVVDKGWVTLQGTCESGEQRERVECVVRELMGVVGVSNEIDLEPSARRAREAARDAPMPRRAA
jgi:osmotically-inducible protein OsmY